MKVEPPCIRHRLEFAGVWFAVALIRRLSPTGCRRLASVLGSLGFVALNRRRDIACENIRLAGITQNETEVRRIARASMIHFLQVALTSLQTAGGAKGQCRIIEEIDPAARTALADPTQGVLLCSGHLGNWEAGLQAVAQQFPLLGIARRMNNPLVESFLQWRQNENIEITPKHDQDASRLLRALSEGRNLGLLFDQHAAGNRGIMVPFFGVPASTYASPAMLHLTTKAPICFCTCIQTDAQTYRLRIDAPFIYPRTGNRKQDTSAILLALNKKLEAAIREAPAQYLWGHRRWRDA